jgi:alpha-beta hydrolase superfamily lysophospholipase
MRLRLMRGIWWLFLALVAVLVTVLLNRGVQAFRAPPLPAWLTTVPEELTVAQLDQSDWDDYLKREAEIAAALRASVMVSASDDSSSPLNRYQRDSRVDPATFERDWNRSYTLMPDGKAIGAVVLLHGLTDSPYSLRHVGLHYREQGFAVVAIRLPGHGTVPAGLTRVDWEAWMAATRLAVREARRLVPAPLPLHIVGFSNGGALAMKYALDAQADAALARPDQLILISPMIGVTRFARLAGLAGLPAMLPALARAAWLDVLPEFNPFKYNSFPINGARQSARLTRSLQQQIVRQADDGSIAGVAPVLTFQSVTDFTVSTPAVLSALYAYLPANGSEVVLFDVNRSAKFTPLFRRATDRALARLMPPLPEPYRITVIANGQGDHGDAIERTIAAGSVDTVDSELAWRFPDTLYSLSHVALPFPMDDPLYGMTPVAEDHPPYGLSLGTLAARGERGALSINLDMLSRATSNPFFPYILASIDRTLGAAPASHVVMTDETKAKAEANARGQRGRPASLPPAYGEDDELADTP